MKSKVGDKSAQTGDTSSSDSVATITEELKSGALGPLY